MLRIACCCLALVAVPVWPAWAAPELVGLRITSDTAQATPDRWEGWAADDLVALRVVAQWSDGEPDTDARRAGAAPLWRADYGWFEAWPVGVDRMVMPVPEPAARWPAASGATALWCTGPAAGAGTITVVYGGRTARLPVVGHEATTQGATPLPADWSNEFSMPRPVNFIADLVAYLLNPLAQPTQSPVMARLLANEFERQPFVDQQLAAARDTSARLEAFIRQWAAGGRRTEEVPAEVLPASLRGDKTQWAICRPEDVSPETQWVCRPAGEIPAGYTRLHGSAPDHHCTYLLLQYLSPFGARLLVDGEFPHCRFFDLQISPPFDPRFPQYAGFGNAEVPIVDADIVPDAAAINPFRRGADRSAAARGYHVRFDLREGNAVTLNEALNPGSMTPTGTAAYRADGAAGNTRVGGPFRATGAFGDGQLIQGLLWARYYAPDRGTGPLAGVRLPRARLELADGTAFWLLPRGQYRWIRRLNRPCAAAPTPSAEPDPSHGSAMGWNKGFGILRGIVTSVLRAAIETNHWDALRGYATKRIRDMDLAIEGRGAEAEPPGNLAASHTCCNYTHYLGRTMTCGDGKVVAVTGQVPLTPRTRGGEPTMAGGEARYWSLTRYMMYAGTLADPRDVLTELGGLMDDELRAPDSGPNRGWYLIVWSRAADRPANASAANGITWQDWGPVSTQFLQLRWISVMPEWHAPAFTPDDDNVPWTRGDWAEPGFELSLTGRNDHRGLMGDRQPVLHYMTREQFEALGARPDPRTLPHSDDWARDPTTAR